MNQGTNENGGNSAAEDDEDDDDADLDDLADDESDYWAIETEININ